MKRRRFVKNGLASAAGAFAVPTIVPSTVFGKQAPSNKINIGQIGCGRIARDHDMPGTMQHDVARIVAVSDLDSNRMLDGKKLVEDYYNKKTGSSQAVDVKMYADYKEMLKDKDIDAFDHRLFRDLAHFLGIKRPHVVVDILEHSLSGLQ